MKSRSHLLFWNRGVSVLKKVFVLSLPGAENKLLVADNHDDAFERRGEVDHAYEYLPVQVNELMIEGL
jgi:hypothetical protein